MGRNFTGGHISLGDIAGARFESAVTWSLLGFARTEDTAGDDRCWVSKWNGGATRQLELRTDRGSAPQNVEVYLDGSRRINTGNIIQIDTWYLFVLANDGTGAAGGVRLWIYGMDGTEVVDITGTHATDDSDNTADVYLGKTQDSFDPHDGDLAWIIYVEDEVTQDDVLAYLYDPINTGLRFEAQYGVQFWLPLFGDGTTEIDWSANGNDGTVTATTAAGEDPPQNVVLLHALRSIAAGAEPPVAEVPLTLALAGVGR